jgi:hypothetical protein
MAKRDTMRGSCGTCTRDYFRRFFADRSRRRLQLTRLDRSVRPFAEPLRGTTLSCEPSAPDADVAYQGHAVVGSVRARGKEAVGWRRSQQPDGRWPRLRAMPG